MPDSRTHRIFLLDSHDIFRMGVRSVLDSAADIEVIGESHEFPEGVAQIIASEPDVAVVGVREGERELLAHLRELRDRESSTRLMVLTRTDDDDLLTSALLAGASAYLHKDLSAGQLLTAVSSVARGHNLVDPVRALRLMRRAQVPGEQPEDPLSSLTNQERRILDLIAEGMSNQEIADRLFLVEKTVRNHVTQVLAKLGVERRTQAALLAARLAQDAESGKPRE